MTVAPPRGGGLLLLASFLWMGLVVGSAATLGCGLAAWRLAATGIWLHEARAAALLALLAAGGSVLCYRLLRFASRRC
ncbi:MAG: hypothetical protein IT204_04150 [Fimbriimonadaceae bacterium]|nr:hypothetical protein [Fimbriimonadaceae bacterium]